MFTLFLLAALAAVCAGAQVSINIGGGHIGKTWRCDTGKFVTSAYSSKFLSPFVVEPPAGSKAGPAAMFETFRYASAGDLSLKVPVPPGNYKVTLLFAEVGDDEADVIKARNFEVDVNGEQVSDGLNLYDVVGIDYPYSLPLSSVAAVDGFIEIKLGRIEGDPILNGLIIDGPDADALVGAEGLGSCETVSVPVPTPAEPSVSSAPAPSASASAAAPLPSESASPAAVPKSAEPSVSSAPAPLASSSAAARKPAEPSVTTTPLPSASSSNAAAPLPSKSASPAAVPSPSSSSSVAPSPLPSASATPSSSMSPAAVPSPSSSSSVAPAAIPSASATPSTSVLPSPTTTPSPMAVPPVGTGNVTVVKLNMGGDNIAPDWRCDTGKFVTSEGAEKFTSPFPMAVNSTLGPDAMFVSHRFVKTGDLKFQIPVPAGEFAISLLFAENWVDSGPDVRLFTVTINEKVIKTANDKTEVSVFSESGGLHMPYELKCGKQASVDGNIVITLGRVPFKNNPMLSGIVISGPGADQLVGDEGLGSCGGPVPSKKPTDASNCNKEVETKFSGTHFAHAVIGGPYVETDFKKQGFASVNLDSTNSHSHFQSDTENGKIVSFKWTWKDATNPAADGNGIVTVTTAKTTQNFPIGVIPLKLVVTDQFCNSASDSTTVTVNSATLPGAFCYFYASNTLDSLPVDISKGQRPEFGTNVGDINFGTTKSFGDFPFKTNAFAVRCSFYIDVPKDAEISYKVVHNGPVKVFHDDKLLASSDALTEDTMTVTPDKSFAAGLQKWQIQYLRPATLEGKLIFQFASGGVIPASTVRHDSATTLPIITGSNKKSGSGEELVLLFGTSFVNNAKVKFGEEEAATVESNAGVIQVRVPTGSGDVGITVSTEAGVSNAISFSYTEAASFPIKFMATTLKTTAGAAFKISKIAVVKYGPDGRLYCGATNSKIYALSVNKNLHVTKTCEKNVFETWSRAVLGMAFDPTSSALKVYFTTSTLFWQEKNIIDDDAIGWKNGKIKSISMDGPTGCFNDDLADVVTGLPVSDHDHGVNAIEFLPNGNMVIAVGGFTNAGISVPSDKLGGVPSNPLSGALVECPTSGTEIGYTSADPFKAQIESGGCKTYATGFRNTFGLELHSNKKLYATDNGPNQSFGGISTDCTGGILPSKTVPDKLILVQPGKCHGHPNINRGLAGAEAECAFEDARCVKPLISNLQSSTNGVMEYRSNIFGDKLKGNLFLSKYAGGNEGRVSRVILDGKGQVATNGVTNIFWPSSGLSIVEGPRGEMVMSRVFKDELLVLKPEYTTPKTPFFISVMPRKGPAAGGNTVLVTGHNFGTAPGATFGAKACTDVKAIDDDSFTCVVPAGVAGEQVSVSVTVGTTTAAAPTGSDYWYF